MTGYENYARTSIKTSDPRQIVVLLYEGAIKFLHQAVDAVERDDRAEMSVGIKKAQAIVHYMTNSLDRENGAGVAENLDRLYAYMRDRLAQANLKADPEPMREVIELLKPLLDAWREIANDPEAAAALQSNRAKQQATVPVETEQAAAEAPPRQEPPEALQAFADDRTPRTAPSRAPAPRPAVAVAGRAAYGIH